METGIYRYCRYEVDGPLLTLTIERPEVLNALHPDAHRELADAFDRYAADPSLRVAIVTGAGERAFSAGADVFRSAYTASGASTSEKKWGPTLVLSMGIGWACRL